MRAHWLQAKHSPEQISGALALSGQRVSTSAIYQHIGEDKKSGGTLYLNLRINGRRRYCHRNKASRVKIPNWRDISQRPKVVERRTRFGDWDADLLEGKNSAHTSKGIIKALSGYRVKTITYDNGLEFARHEEVSAALGAAGHFCKPYSLWEIGGVENFNDLVRQYYQKGSVLSSFTQTALKQTEVDINDRPRKVRGYKSSGHYTEQLAA